MNKQELKAKLAEPSGIEKRFFSSQFRMNEDKEIRTVEGVACRMNQVYSMGWYDEKINTGAFDGVLEISDIRCLFNHDPNQLLARTKSGTLKVWIEGDEVKYRFNLPKTRADIQEMLDRGDLGESSFQFIIEDEDWTPETRAGVQRWTREIKKFEIIYDVAPVTFPANPDTSVAKRSFEAFNAEKEQPKPEKRTIPLALLEKELELL